MEQEQLQEEINNLGPVEVKKRLEESLGAWKDVPLKIGVTGRSGVGKSTFINAIRGLSPGTEGCAKVGVTETTTKVTMYPHPQNKNLELYDLPGAGTPTFSIETFFKDERIKFDMFDMFLIIASDRFAENDLRLAREIKALNKQFIFIRTKIGQDVENQKKSNKYLFESNPDAVRDIVQTVKADCKANLKEFGAKKVFVIDSYEYKNSEYDFDSLTEELINNFPALKREALILSLPSITPTIINQKKKVVERLLWKYAILALIGGAGIGAATAVAAGVLDMNVIVNAALFIRTQLGLDGAGLTGVLKLMSVGIELTPNGIKTFCMAQPFIVKACTALRIPFLSSTVDVSSAYSSTTATLTRILDIMYHDAIQVIQHIAQ